MRKKNFGAFELLVIKRDKIFKRRLTVLALCFLSVWFFLDEFYLCVIDNILVSSNSLNVKDVYNIQRI